MTRMETPSRRRAASARAAVQSRRAIRCASVRSLGPER